MLADFRNGEGCWLRLIAADTRGHKSRSYVLGIGRIDVPQVGAASAAIGTGSILKVSENSHDMTPITPHGKDLRKGRVSLDNHAYMVTTVTAGREKVFADLFSGRILVNCLRSQHDLGQVDSLAFVVMPDHLHWLLVLRQGASLSSVMRAVKGRSSRLIGDYRRDAPATSPHKPLWQEGFHDHALRKDEDLQAAARYVVANPLRAGVVSRIGDYPLWDAKWLI